VKRGTPTHPKVRALMRALGLPRYSVVGLLELLWHFTAQYTPRGNIGRYSDVDIAEALGWATEEKDAEKKKDAEKLISALVETSWLERNSKHRLVIHDWPDHADQAVKKKLSRYGLDFINISPDMDGQSPDMDITPVPVPVPEPVPEPGPHTPTPTPTPDEVPTPSHPAFQAAISAYEVKFGPVPDLAAFGDMLNDYGPGALSQAISKSKKPSLPYIRSIAKRLWIEGPDEEERPKQPWEMTAAEQEAKLREDGVI